MQRLAVSTAANLCRHLPVECAHLVADAVPLMTNLLSHHDQRVLEHTCVGFSRLVDAFTHSADTLETLAAHGLLPNIVRLLGGMVSDADARASRLSGGGDAPVTLSDGTYTMLLKMSANICRGSGTMCAQLLQLQVRRLPACLLYTSPSPRD